MKSLTVQYLTALGFIIGLLGMPMQAQAQQSIPGSPQGFNGLVWDPPTQQGYYAPDADRQYSTPYRPRRHVDRSAR
jgi:hypothetical protein